MARSGRSVGAQLVLVGAGTPERGEAALLEEMLAGWRRQQLARRLHASTIEDREGVVRRFVEFTQG